MMQPTILQFLEALQNPESSFATLCGVEVCCDEQGQPILRRTTRFAEAEIRWQGEKYLLAMPLSVAAQAQCERVLWRLQGLHEPFLVPIRRLAGELRVLDFAGSERHCDLILQALPGEPLADAYGYTTGDELSAAIAHLKAALQASNFAHRNLKVENLRWCEGRLLPIRYFDATLDGAVEADLKALDRIHEELVGSPEMGCSDCDLPYSPIGVLTGHRWVGNEFEGLICIEDEAGYGFVDPYNRVVIEPQYRWADDFHEGRAVVETASGMGLINREGQYILPPIYEIVEYRYSDSLILVRQNGLWARFDYLGQQISSFGVEVEI